MEWLKDWSPIIISVLTFFFACFVPFIKGRQITTKKTEEKLERQRYQVRGELFNLYNLCKLKGFKTYQEQCSFNDTFDYYKNKLKGNSWAESIKKEFEDLPTLERMFSKEEIQNKITGEKD